MIASAPASALRAHEELFAYWSSRRVGGRLPGRGDIDPGHIKSLLPGVSLIDVRRDPLDFRLRLAGTGLYGVYGGEITGKRIDEVYGEGVVDYWRGELGRIIETGRPAAGRQSLAWRGVAGLSLLWLRLPLAADGVRVDMVLGYDTVLGPHVNAPTGLRAA